MERPELSDYKDEIHHHNGTTEDRWRYNEYAEDLGKHINHLEKYISHLESKELIDFGNYLRSKERKKRTLKVDRGNVTHADLENWRELRKQGQ